MTSLGKLSLAPGRCTPSHLAAGNDYERTLFPTQLKNLQSRSMPTVLGFDADIPKILKLSASEPVRICARQI